MVNIKMMPGLLLLILFTHNVVLGENNSSTLTFKPDVGEIVELKPDCPMTLFKSDVIYSKVFHNCFVMSNDFVCSSAHKYERSYAFSIAETLLRTCYDFFNIDSSQYTFLRELVLKHQSSDPLCEPTTNKCECGIFLQEERFNHMKIEKSLKDASTQWQQDFEVCAIVRKQLLIDNTTKNQAIQECNEKMLKETANLEKCQKRKIEESEKAEKSNTVIQEKAEELNKCYNVQKECNKNLTSVQKTLNICESNVTSMNVKRTIDYKQCENERDEMKAELKGALLPVSSLPQSIYMSSDHREYFRSALKRRLTEELIVYHMNSHLRSTAFRSKYGSYDLATPALTVRAPNQLLTAMCVAHCKDVKNRKANGRKIDYIEYEFPSEIQHTKKYRPPTGLSLEIDGKINFWQLQYEIDMNDVGRFWQQFDMEDKTHVILGRAPKRSYEYCVCVLHENINERMRHVEKVTDQGNSGNSWFTQKWFQNTDNGLAYQQPQYQSQSSYSYYHNPYQRTQAYTPRYTYSRRRSF